MPAKLIAPANPGTGKLLQFWLFVFLLPAFSGKLALSFYADSIAAKAFAVNCQKLRQESEAFTRDLQPEKLLADAVSSTKKRLQQTDWHTIAKIDLSNLCRQFSEDFTTRHAMSPAFFGISDIESGVSGGYSPPGSTISPGRKSFEIIMARLYPGKEPLSDIQKKRYQQICKTIFGNFIEPADRPGLMRSGFFLRNRSDRLFIVHDSFTDPASQKKIAFFLVFSENSIGLGKILRLARKRADNTEFKRGYAILTTLPERDFQVSPDGRLFYATVLPPATLRIGSHKGKSWYDRVISDKSARQRPSQLPFMIVALNDKTAMQISQNKLSLINLALLIYAFAGLAIVRQYLGNGLRPSLLRQRFKFAILTATLLPFLAFFYTANNFKNHFSRALLSTQQQNIVNDLQMLELNILNNDLRERQNTTEFVAQLNKIRAEDTDKLRRILNANVGKLYEGYGFLRSDGAYLEHFPIEASTSDSDLDKLQILKETVFGQLYNIFSVTGVLRPEFAKNVANIPEYRKWKAYELYYNEVDRDSFCSNNGKYFLSSNAEQNYYRMSQHHLFPESDKTELWAGIILIKNARAAVEKYLSSQETNHLTFKRRDGLVTHSAIFRMHADSYELDNSFAWPPGAMNEPDMLAAAECLNESIRETSWHQFDKNGMVTLYAVKAMADLPFILVSRSIISQNAVTESLFRIAGLLSIPYAMALIALLSSLMSDVFLKPINLLMRGIDSLEKGNYPTIDYSAANELGKLIDNFNLMSEGMRQHKLLQRFISDEVASTISEEAETMRETSGATVYRVVMFIHIREFAALTEKLPPEEVITLLNVYFSEMEPIIRQSGAQIDKYIGDAIMLSFSSERCHNQPEVAACKAAIGCLKAMAALNDKLCAKSLPPVLTGTGIAAGEVIRGKIGAHHGRKDFTLIGNTVNLAARLEAASHFDGFPHILVDESVAEKAKEAIELFLHGRIDGRNGYH